MWGWLKGDRKKAEEQVVKPVTRTDAEYLRLLNDLLDQLAVEPGYATLMAWSIIQGVKEGELAVWLRGATEQFDESLRGRLELLVSLRRGDLSLAAEEVLGTAKTTVQDFNSDDAEGWFDRGNELFGLGRYEEALESYDRAISFKHDDHEAWSNRGVSLGDLGRHEEALKSYDRAISFKHDKHEAWSNRAVSLCDLGRYEEAIESYDRAISLNHNDYKAWSNRGNALGDLGRYEEAIESYDRAISFNYNDHKAWSNRGVYLGALGCHEEALKSYNQAISFNDNDHKAWFGRGNSLDKLGRYEEAIENYQQGLSHLRPTTHPEGWGILYQGLGQLHYCKGQNNFDKFPLDARVYYRQALTNFQTAETTLTKFPELHLELIQDFMQVYFALREPETANSYREQGRELFKQLLNNKSPRQRRKLLAKFNSFRQLEVDILLQQQQPIMALETAELCKNLCLESLLSALQENIVSPSFAQIQTLLQPHIAIIYWHLSPSTLSTFILQPGNQEPMAFYSDNLTALQSWILQWDKINTVSTTPQDGSKKKTDEDLAPAFATLDWSKLQEILDIPQITQHLQQQPGITRLILIPHQDLHRLPLHQFFAQYPVTYLPSLQIALNLQQKAPAAPPLIVDLVQPPQGSNLPNAEVEIVAINAILPSGRILPSSQVTKPKFLDFIGKAAQENTSKTPQRILHFTGHGEHFSRCPQASCLYLNNNQTITCPDLATSNLRPYHLVVLSACQTSIANHQTLQDEYIGLVSACLSGGASYTLNTLWSINDKISSPLLIYFYQQLAQNIPAPQAIHNASQWLRHITSDQLSQFYTQLYQHPKLSHQDEVLEKISVIIELLRGLEPTDRPYQDPYYWAAFTISGAVPQTS
jgi:CHAT domain-containing protein/Flp pilus assembly protein TadD